MLNQSALYLMISAVESSPIAYWAEIRDVRRDEKGNVLSFQVRDGGLEDARVSRHWVTINARKIIIAAKKLLLGEIKVRKDIAAQFIGKEWDFDYEGVDCIIQSIRYKKLVFG